MTHQPDDTGEHESGDPREVLRTMWAAQGSSAADLDDCGPTRSCKNMQYVSFDGMAEPGSDLRQAWRDKLAREGKLSTAGGSLRDLVLGPDEAR